MLEKMRLDDYKRTLDEAFVSNNPLVGTTTIFSLLVPYTFLNTFGSLNTFGRLYNKTWRKSKPVNGKKYSETGN